MRILHTSDWHLGIGTGPLSRAPDHEVFGDWLVQTVVAHQVDAVVIAGDVFDVASPSAEAQRGWYRLLTRLADTGLPQVVVVGGNHDGASRLEAPAEVLAGWRVHVVGGLEADRARCLTLLRDRAGEPRAVCLAVPYVHEFRLGVRTTDTDRAAVRQQFVERFTELYKTLADLAEERWPGLPIVATGHLTMGRPDDAPLAIHAAGGVEGVPASVIDPRIRYLALGHLHRAGRVAPRAWYSGSPIALQPREAESPRQVLLVDLPDDGGEVAVTPLEVPPPRALLPITGSVADILQTIDALPLEIVGLPPHLFLRVLTDAPVVDLHLQLEASLARWPEATRPILVDLRQEAPTAAAWEVGSTAAPSVEAEVTVDDVFAFLLASKGVQDGAALTDLVRQIATASAEDRAKMLEMVEGAEG